MNRKRGERILAETFYDTCRILVFVIFGVLLVFGLAMAVWKLSEWVMQF